MLSIEPGTTITTTDSERYFTDMEDEGMCHCCRRRPAAGYVRSHQVYLGSLCYACWKSGDPDRSSKHNSSTVNGRFAARS